MGEKNALDGMLTMVNLMSLVDRKLARPKKTKKISVTQRQVYDVKRGQVVTLTTENVTYTENSE